MRAWFVAAALAIAHAASNDSSARSEIITLAHPADISSHIAAAIVSEDSNDDDLVVIANDKTMNESKDTALGAVPLNLVVMAGQSSDDDWNTSSSDADDDQGTLDSFSPHGTCVRCNLQHATCKGCMERLRENVKQSLQSHKSDDSWTLVDTSGATDGKACTGAVENDEKAPEKKGNPSPRKSRRISKQSEPATYVEPETPQVLARMGITPSQPIPIPRHDYRGSFTYDHAMNWTREAKKVAPQELGIQSAPIPHKHDA